MPPPQSSTSSRRRFQSPYWDKPPAGFEHVSPARYKEMQAAGQVPQSVVNPSSSHLQGTKYARPNQNDPMEAVRAAAAVINAALSIKNQPTSMAAAAAAAAALQSKTLINNAPAITRQARRLYVGNIPFGCTDEDLIEFFRTTMEACNFIRQPSGNPVLACQINLDKNFAFLEFRTVEETTSAMALDGVLCKGQPLKIRRPHDYQPIPGSEPTPIGSTLATSATTFGSTTTKSQSYNNNNNSNSFINSDQMIPHIPGVISTNVADSPNKIYIGGIPLYLTDDQIKEILSSFGQLKAFNLIRDPITLASKGYAFCEFLNPNMTDPAIHGLNGFEMGDKKLIVQRASVGAKSGPLAANNNNNINPSTAAATATVAAVSAPIAAQIITSSSSSAAMVAPVQIQVPGLPSITQASGAPRVLTEILCLMNMVEPDELKDDQEYSDIIEDILDECQKYGRVRSIEIPRPKKDGSHVAGVGKVFIEFDSPTEAQRAQINLAGRRFANRIVVTSYFDRERYRNKEF